MELFYGALIFAGLALIGITISFIGFTILFWLFTKVFDMEFSWKISFKYFLGLVLFKSVVSS